MIVMLKRRDKSGNWLRKARAQSFLGHSLALLLVVLPSAAQKHDPASAGNPVALISQALQSNQFAHGVELSKQALARTPNDPRLWTLQALALAGLGDPTKALQSYHQAIKIAPNYLPALQGAAQLEYATQSPAAQATLERVVTLLPGDETAHAMLGVISFRKHDCAAATTHFEQARNVIAARNDVQLQLTACLMELSRFADAASILQALNAAQPANSAIRYDLALAQWKAGQLPAAQATLEPPLQAGNASSDDLTLAAQIFEAQGNTPRALDMLRQAMLLDRRNKSAYLDFANLAYQHGSVQVGLDMINVGLRELPNEAELYFARGVLLAESSNIDLAFEDFDRARQLDPHLAFVATAQGIAESQTHHFAAAEQKFRAQVKVHSDDALAWYLLAEALSERQLTVGSTEYRELIQAGQTAARLAPGQTDAHNLLASMYLRYGDPAQAVAEARASLAIKPGDPQALYQLLMAVRKVGPKEQVPVIVKRLMAARADAELETEKSRKHMLTELSGSSATTPNP